VKSIHLGECNGYTLRWPQSGGKAGTGRNKTGSIQILSGNRLVKSIRFTVGDVDSKRAAWNKAQEFTRSQPRGASLTELAVMNKKLSAAEKLYEALRSIDQSYERIQPPAVQETIEAALAAWQEANK
jgi:hypothetical protein